MSPLIGGRSFCVTEGRRILDFPEQLDGLPDSTKVLATIRPSAVLRATDRDEMDCGLRDDLAVAAHALDDSSATD